MRTQKQFEVIYKNDNDTLEHSWKCWATNKDGAKYQFEAKFENAKVKRINKIG
jgi:hypothetical protein